MQDFSASLPMLLYRALHVVMPRFRAIFAEFGLTEPQWRVLRVLWKHEEITFRELAETTLVPAPSLVGVVDRLHAGGLAERRRSDSDRRNVYVRATSSGHALEAEVMPAVEAAYRDLRAMLDDETWDGLVNGLQLLAAAKTNAGADAGADERPRTVHRRHGASTSRGDSS